MVRKPNHIIKRVEGKDKELLLSLSDVDIHLDRLKDLFAVDENDKSMFEAEDILNVTYAEFEKSIGVLRTINKGSISTTVGRYIFNIFINDKDNQYFYKTCGFVNDPLNKGNIKKFEKKMADALLMDEITTDDYFDFIDRRNWIAYNVVSFLSPSLTSNVLIPRKNVTDKKKQLLKKYEKELKEDPVNTSAKIEKELLELAKGNLKGDSGLAIFDSGARANYDNNFKNMSVMRGVMIGIDGKVVFSPNSLVEGIDKESIDGYANNLVSGSYGRAIETKTGGYLTKQLVSAFQNVILGDAESDCKTTEYLEVKINASDIKNNFFQLRYISEGNNLVLLTKDNINSYVGKKVKMRSPMYCRNEKICNKCAGELYYKLGVKNVGLLFSRMGGILLNVSMKSFHDSSIKVREVSLADIIK